MMKKILPALFILGFTFSAYAVQSGFYMGGQLGETNTHNKNHEFKLSDGTMTTTKPSTTGLGAGIFTGYQFNPYAAMEFGFIQYAPSTYKPAGDVSGVCGNPQIRENALNLLAKGTLPFDNFGLFGKAGMAYLRSSPSGSLSNDAMDGGCNSSGNHTTSTIRPMLALGVSYDVTQNWVADLSFSRVFGGGNVQSADFVALGISYHFVDKMCGQFIC